MPKRYSRKRVRDEALHAQWDAQPDSAFEPFGLTRDEVKAAQLELDGHIVIPGDPTYDTDRLLSNPAFNPSPAMIIFCKSESDVDVALSVARAAPVPFTVRSGGHCTAGF